MPYNYLTPTGVIVPDTSTIKADVQNEYVSRFGPDLLLADDSPQGRLIDVETTARDGVVRLAAELANQINPNISTGIFLKGIAALHGIKPSAKQFTVLTGVELVGLPSTVIPAGSRIADAGGHYFKSVTQLTIDTSHKVIGDFQAVVPGPYQPALGSVTQIIDGVYGWQSVTSLGTAVPGSFEETDDQLRLARNAKLGLLSKGPVAGIMANILSAANVRWATIRENDSSSSVAKDGVVMSASSTWVCVQGGTDDDIGYAILRSKQTGSPLTQGVNNGTPVAFEITDPISGQRYPMLFTRPVPVPVMLRVTVSKGTAINASVAVPDAAIRYANGEVSGERGFVVGAEVSPFETAAAINLQLPELFIRKVEVAPVGGVFSTDTLPIALWEVATLASGNVTVMVV